MAFSFRAHRRELWVWVAAIAAALTATFIYLWLTDEEYFAGLMGDFGPAKQREWAEKLVAGLNTHDPDRVPVLTFSGRLTDAQRETIEAAMPAPRCHYELVSVQDRGKRGLLPTPGIDSDNGTYRFDMTVDEQCPGTARIRVLGVMATAEMGFYDPAYFVQ